MSPPNERINTATSYWTRTKQQEEICNEAYQPRRNITTCSIISAGGGTSVIRRCGLLLLLRAQQAALLGGVLGSFWYRWRSVWSTLLHVIWGVSLLLLHLRYVRSFTSLFVCVFGALADPRATFPINSLFQEAAKCE